MNARVWIVALIVTAVLAGATGFFIASRRSSANPAYPTAVPQTQRRVLYWHDPMRPDVKFDKPGKSPFMDMDLVPVYADEESSAAVRIDPALRQSLGIRLGHVEQRSLATSLRVVGTVALDERQTAVVQSRVEGYIEHLYVKAALEHVRRNQPIADIVAPDWLAAEREYLALLDTKSSPTEQIRDAARERLKVLGIPQATILEIERSRKVKANTTLTAPLDGVVSGLSVREGSTVAAGAPIARINGLSIVWVNAQVPEGDIAGLKPGGHVVATAAAWPSQRFDGEVLAILPEVNEKTRTLSVRIAVRNAAEKLVPGMFAAVTWENQPEQNQLWVPTEAVIRTGRRNVVIVAREQGGFDPVNVELGAEREGFSAITAGLEAGQSVVLSGQFLIDSEASLRSALDRLHGAHAP
jgi:Cu(I)/Ag(I) efflux system membrane fusion protein